MIKESCQLTTLFLRDTIQLHQSSKSHNRRPIQLGVSYSGLRICSKGDPASFQRITKRDRWLESWRAHLVVPPLWFQSAKVTNSTARFAVRQQLDTRVVRWEPL